jgi:hypothetical protein
MFSFARVVPNKEANRSTKYFVIIGVRGYLLVSGDPEYIVSVKGKILPS